ncbi:DUF4190 domain-containing protein, partial [Georgenia sp. 10Sc9-8]|nr:DUF4190 domain-containing protein [Georgenia halotolerans]
PQYGSSDAYQPPQYGGDQGDYRGSAPQYGSGQQGGYQQPGHQQPGYGSSYGAPGQYGPGGPYQEQPRNGLGIAALVVGIVSLLVAWLPFIGLISVLGGVVGIVLGAMGLKRVGRGEATNRGTAVAGIVVSVVAILLAIAATVFGSYWISQVMPELFGEEFQQCVESAGNSQEELEQCLQESGL